MEAYEKGKELIVKEIIEDAQKEADRLVEDAKKRAEEKIMFAKNQAESIVNEAKKKAEEQINILQKRYVSFIELETKKRRMKLRENVFNMVIEKVKQRLRKMINEPEYRSILERWIYEAAVGLYENEAIIRTSNEEINLIDGKILKDIEEKLKENEKLEVKLKLDSKKFLKGQGVILFSLDGKRAFNNEVSTRILRKQREIHGIIYDALLDKIE